MSFICGESIGSGGNGSVYPILPQMYDKKDSTQEMVVKILDDMKHYNRIERFKKEINTVIDLIDQGVEGIIPIIDKHCPDVLSEGEEIWYVMPKATPFTIADQKKRRKSLVNILLDMIMLAKTISVIHNNGIAHRDIKPENIMIYNGRLMLTDFGLVWTIDGKRITHKHERLGPYRIMPRELEEYDGETLFDYRPSDVYLFAKVLWMMIRNDNNGFRGQYNRGDRQIYLDHNELKISVSTLEPIHRMLEEATKEDPNNRITIDQCIEYMQRQIRIIRGEEPENLIRALCYDEQIKQAKEEILVEETIVTDIQEIYKTIKRVIETAYIFVESADKKNPHAERKQIYVQACRIKSDKVIDLIQYQDGAEPIIFRICVDKMRIQMKKNTITIQLCMIDSITREGNVLWKDYNKNPTQTCSLVLLTEVEHIFITSPCGN